MKKSLMRKLFLLTTGFLMTILFSVVVFAETTGPPVGAEKVIKTSAKVIAGTYGYIDTGQDKVIKTVVKSAGPWNKAEAAITMNKVIGDETLRVVSSPQKVIKTSAKVIAASGYINTGQEADATVISYSTGGEAHKALSPQRVYTEADAATVNKSTGESTLIRVTNSPQVAFNDTGQETRTAATRYHDRDGAIAYSAISQSHKNVTTAGLLLLAALYAVMYGGGGRNKIGKMRTFWRQVLPRGSTVKRVLSTMATLLKETISGRRQELVLQA